MSSADISRTQRADVESPSGLCLRLEDWLARDIPPPNFLLGNWLSTTSRVLMVAPTGLGKTHFAMALGLAVASGESFLHWKCMRPARVLFIDGEMSRRQLKVRLEDAFKRLGGEIPSSFFALSRDDVSGMAPLNTHQGQSFIEDVIDFIGGVDLIIFDNVMALIAGDMKEEQSWSDTMPWIKNLTRKEIGQIWIHHTGHNESHSYGTKTREWQMDSVFMLEKEECEEADICFRLRFNKSRERDPQNRSDFAAVPVKLLNGVGA